MTMQPQQQKAILDTLEKVRKQTDAFIVVGICDETFFWTVDDMASPETIELLLRQSAAPVGESIRRKRGTR